MFFSFDLFDNGLIDSSDFSLINVNLFVMQLFIEKILNPKSILIYEREEYKVQYSNEANCEQ